MITNEDYTKYESMIYKIANKFKNNIYGIDIEDIYQIGSLGMIRAYKTYQEGKGMSFNTYMYSCISWAIKKSFRIHSQKEDYYLYDYAVKVILSRIFIYNKIFLKKYLENIKY